MLREEHVPFFAKAGAHAHYQSMFCDNLSAGKVCRQARYLGPPYTFNGSHNSEVEERLVAAKLGWVACGRFWSRLPSCHKGKLCVFRGMVYTPLLAGLETCVLDKSAYKKLDTCVLRFGRRLMQGQACREVEQVDGTIEYKALPSSAVFAVLRLLPCKDELFIRRVRWYQSMARTPSLHSIWFACMFGNFSFELHSVINDNGSISSDAHPWAQQFHDDVSRLAEIEGGDTLVWLLAGQPLRLFTDLRDDFLRLDVTFFRRIPFGEAIPPPELQPSPDPLPQGLPSHAEENAEVDEQFSCAPGRYQGDLPTKPSVPRKGNVPCRRGSHTSMLGLQSFELPSKTQPALGDHDKQAIQSHRNTATDPEAMSQAVFVCQLRKAYDRDSMKVSFSVHRDVEPALKVGQAPRAGLEREVQDVIDELTAVLGDK
eukprot:s87_g7.t1